MDNMEIMLEWWLVLAILTVFCVFVAVMYILESLGLYTIAKRREIACPWLAWIPVARPWILGSIHDNHKWMASGDFTKMRITLLVFAILDAVGAFLGTYAWSKLDAWALGVWFIVYRIPVLIFKIVALIFRCKAYYSLYASCKPKRAVLFLVLSILTPAAPFLIFAYRKSDEGLYASQYEI